ncbi:hypothetical protein ONZ45_g18917 [Pleurotus djamor]|nr:hypothetical protein ONZ45_g18917 [Pleurotus djamor]
MDFPSPLRREDNIVTSLPLGAIHNLRFWGSMDDEEGQAWSKLLPFLVHLRSVHTDRVEILRLLVGPEPSSPNITSADFNNLDLLTIRVETEWRAKDEDWMFFISLCRIRKEHGKPIRSVDIQDCDIQKPQLRELERYTKVGYERDYYPDTEEEETESEEGEYEDEDEEDEENGN